MIDLTLSSTSSIVIAARGARARDSVTGDACATNELRPSMLAVGALKEAEKERRASIFEAVLSAQSGTAAARRVRRSWGANARSAQAGGGLRNLRAGVGRRWSCAVEGAASLGGRPSAPTREERSPILDRCT